VPLTSRQRRDLLAASHPLKPVVTVSHENVSPEAVAQVRAAFQREELIKVRIHAPTRKECDAAADHLARAVPCEIVTRIGRVVLLYRHKRARPSDERVRVVPVAADMGRAPL